MRRNTMAGEKQSLTPQQPLDPRELATQLDGSVASRNPEWRPGFSRLHAGGVSGSKPNLWICWKWSSRTVVTQASPGWDVTALDVPACLI
jgi:hypothetical protein